MSFGVTSDGFVRKTLTDIIEEKQEKAQEVFGSDVDLTESSPLELFLEVVAVEEADLWEKLEDAYYSCFVDSASGASLDQIATLVGVIRNPATYASGLVEFLGASGTYIPLLTEVRTAAEIGFRTNAAGWIPSGVAVSVPIDAAEPGEDWNVAANTIVELVEAIAGVTDVTNPNATVGGADLETDTSLRVRIKGSLARASVSTLEALIANVEEVDDVESVTGSEDLVAHSAALVVYGGADADIDVMIAEVKPAGIPVTWSRPTSINIYVTADITQDGSIAEATIVNAISTFINGLAVGEDVKYSDLLVAIMAIEGMTDVELTTSKTSPPSGKVNIEIDDDEVSFTQSSYIVVS